MKKALLIVLMFLCIPGCSQSSDNRISSSPPSVESMQSQPQSSEDTSEYKNEVFSVPDPAKTNSFTEIVIPPHFSQEYLELDLSFVGFTEPVKLASFMVGNVTFRAYDSSFFKCYPNDYNAIKVNDFYHDDEKNCLVLCVKIGGDIDDSDAEFYVVVLDYASKKSYKIKTDLISHDPQITLADLTRDGLEEIIVSNATNGYHSGTLFEVIRFDTDRLKSIYKYIDEKEYIPEPPFSAHLTDNYKAVIECKALDLKKTVSLLDIGLTKEDLEINNVITPENDSDHYYKTQFFRCYKNGIIQKENLEIDAYSAPLDDKEGLQYISNYNIDDNVDYYELKLMYRVYVGKWHEICQAFAYMKYNKVTDTFELDKASLSMEQF